jgi:hypothetical protein
MIHDEVLALVPSSSHAILPSFHKHADSQPVSQTWTSSYVGLTPLSSKLGLGLSKYEPDTTAGSKYSGVNKSGIGCEITLTTSGYTHNKPSLFHFEQCIFRTSKEHKATAGIEMSSTCKGPILLRPCFLM